ncbi:MAG: hypothetical protein IKO84_00700 [Butyrivibrio sp.]|nr:hypothetical protein [Butyrivibrio sp.]
MLVRNSYYLTVTFGIDTYEAYLKWCTKAKKLLGKTVIKKNM